MKVKFCTSAIIKICISSFTCITYDKNNVLEQIINIGLCKKDNVIIIFFLPVHCCESLSKEYKESKIFEQVQQ